MKEEIYERLKPYEKILANAYKANYVRVINSTQSKELDSIYQELFNQKSRIVTGCGHCVLSDIKRMGKEYFEHKDMEQAINSVNELGEQFQQAAKSVDELNEQIEQLHKEDEPKDVTINKSETKGKKKNNKVINKNK